MILHGSGDEELKFNLSGKKSSYSWTGKFEGVIPMLDRRYKETDSPTIRAEIEKFMSVHPCPTCEGRRLRPEALAVTVHGKAIDELSRAAGRGSAAPGSGDAAARRARAGRSPRRWSRRSATASASSTTSASAT